MKQLSIFPFRGWTVSLMLAIGMMASAKNVNVQDYGVIADGVTLQTEKIQQAIDECASTGGGMVVFTPGRYLTGTLQLRSHVELRIERGAIILGSTNVPGDYPIRALIYAEGIEDAGISGHGIINGQADSPDYLATHGKSSPNRPQAIFFNKCENMTVQDIEIRNGDGWTFQLSQCDGVRIHGIKIYSFMQENNDGIDLEARNVTISDCIVECDDDAICLKSISPNFMVENISISNCIVASNCNPIKFGTPCVTGYRNIAINNCVIRPALEDNIRNWPEQYDRLPSGTITGLSGIALESPDGGILEHVTISNISMTGIITPIFINLNKRSGNGTGYIKDITISNVTAVANGILPSIISGIPGCRVSDITLRDITVEHEGGEKAMTERLQENLKGYPENRMYGRKNPAAGLFVRHADNVKVYNMRVIARNKDERPAVVADDVNGLEISGLQAVNTGESLVQNIESRHVTLNGKNVK